MKRSITGGQKTTSGRSSRPAATAKLAALLAANSNALARPRLVGPAAATTSRAKAATSAGTIWLCQRATTAVTSLSTVTILWQVP